MNRLIPSLLILLTLACKREIAPPVMTHAEPQPKIDRAANQAGVADGPVAAPAQPEARDRMIVRTADVRIVVADTTRAVQSITAATEAVGGYVSDSRIWRDGELLNATLTLRVPAAQLTPALAQIRKAAKRVDNETIATSDVSSEYVDLRARLRNLEAAEVELRQLMSGVREHSKQASEVLEIHRHITMIRGEIEQTRGRMRYLETVAELAAINLALIPDAIAQPVVQPGWQPVVVLKDAGRALFEALVGVATFVIWLVIYIVPMVVLALFTTWVLWKLLRHLRYKHVS